MIVKRLFRFCFRDDINKIFERMAVRMIPIFVKIMRINGIIATKSKSNIGK